MELVDQAVLLKGIRKKKVKIEKYNQKMLLTSLGNTNIMTYCY